jgi:hypothetical protein
MYTSILFSFKIYFRNVQISLVLCLRPESDSPGCNLAVFSPDGREYGCFEVVDTL